MTDQCTLAAKPSEIVSNVSGWIPRPVANGSTKLAQENERLRHQIAEWHKMEKELRWAKGAAEEANRAKDQFLAYVSHELRTPLAAILGMTDLALEEELRPCVRDYLRTTKASTGSLLALVNQILDFSKIESGKIVLESIPFSLRTMVEETRKLLSPRVTEKGLTLACQFADDVPDRLMGDPLRLGQIFVNLIGNATKFTERGEIDVRATVRSENPQECLLEFAVSDTGIGISAEDQQRIFSPFVQADSSIARKYGGTGLGLAIASTLTDAMGGRMWVQSQLGSGSQFHFTARFDKPQDSAVVPATDNAAGKQHNREPRPGRSLKVLLAEDDRSNQKLALYVLSKLGHAVQLAANGREAIALLEHNAFDIVFMDLEMPVMNGLEATEAVRCLDDSRKARVPIVAMTAHSGNGDEARCLAAGMDAYLSKPINAQKLMELAEELTSGRIGSSGNHNGHSANSVAGCRPRVAVSN